MFLCEMWLLDCFFFFLNSAHLICRSTDISKCFRGPFDFEITRVDCTLKFFVEKVREAFADAKASHSFPTKHIGLLEK